MPNSWQETTAKAAEIQSKRTEEIRAEEAKTLWKLLRLARMRNPILQREPKLLTDEDVIDARVTDVPQLGRGK